MENAVFRTKANEWLQHNVTRNEGQTKVTVSSDRINLYNANLAKKILVLDYFDGRQTPLSYTAMGMIGSMPEFLDYFKLSEDRVTDAISDEVSMGKLLVEQPAIIRSSDQNIDDNYVHSIVRAYLILKKYAVWVPAFSSTNVPYKIYDTKGLSRKHGDDGIPDYYKVITTGKSNIECRMDARHKTPRVKKSAKFTPLPEAFISGLMLYTKTGERNTPEIRYSRTLIQDAVNAFLNLDLATYTELWEKNLVKKKYIENAHKGDVYDEDEL